MGEAAHGPERWSADGRSVVLAEQYSLEVVDSKNA